MTNLFQKIFIILLSVSYNNSLFANEFELDGIFYSIIDNNSHEVAVEKGGQYNGYINIPSTIEYNGQIYTITSIGQGAFYRCKDLISVTLPATLKSIGGQFI